MGAVLGQVPPSLDAPSPGELWELLQAGRKLRGLGRQGLYDLLRWGPMAIADLAAEWFETPALRAAICARGVFGMQAGPRSAGTTASWLLQTAQEGHPTGAVTVVSGGPGALSAALAVAATGAGAEIRRTARVASIEIGDAGVRGVVLASGERIEATRRHLGRRSPAHVPAARRSGPPAAVVPPAGPQLPRQRRRREGQPGGARVCRRLPGSMRSGMPAEQALSGRLLVGDEPDEFEKAFDCTKYGRMSDRPWLEVTVPSLSDSTLAPAGQHVLSIYAQYAPYRLREGDWESHRDALGDLVMARLATVMPDLKSRVVAGEVLTPLDLERRYGLTGGHIFHGEHALDQLYAMRPVLGWAQHRTPIRGLYLCGAGTHPGGGVTGAPGAHAARVIGKDLRRATRRT